VKPSRILYHQGAPLDHFSLFAADVGAREVLHDRLVERGATDGNIGNSAGSCASSSSRIPTAEMST
jgi:hypothetical protein